MHSATLLRRNLRHHARAHAAILLGTLIATATLTGALLVGDSVRESLRERALRRLATAVQALAPEGRTFRRALDLSDLAPTTALLQVQATASRPDATARAGQVQLWGTFHRWPVPPGEVHLNAPLARKLQAAPGDTLIFRMLPAGGSPLESAVRENRDRTVALRLTVSRILTNAADAAWLQLRSSGQEPLNAFVNGEELARRTGLEGRANVLILHENPAGQPTTERLQQALAERWTLADAELKLTPLPGAVQLSSPRVFLDPPVERAALHPALATNPIPLLTYLANKIQAGTNLVPYSMITAAGPPFTPPDLPPGEIILTGWLQDQLRVATGDRVELAWFVPDSGARLVEVTNHFRVRGAVPLRRDTALMPEFPGIEDAETTRDWDAGFPLIYKIRPEDDDYWTEYRGTPKAFISLAAGQRHWANRFGALTAVRYPLPAGANPTNEIPRLERELRARLDPADFGLTILPVRAQALAAASQGQDFGQLFLGFSFFLLAAALLLVALLFRLSLEQRAVETGTLLALGFTARRIRWLMLAETSLPLLLGTILGLLAGLGYARAMLWALGHLWSAATGDFALRFAAAPASFAVGFTASLGVAALTVLWVLYRQARQPAHALLTGAAAPVPLPARARPSRLRPSAALLAWVALALALGLILFATTGARSPRPAIFFGAGSLLLIAGLLAVSALLRRTAAARPSSLTVASLGWRGNARRRTRSLTTVALLACGTFMIVAVGAFRQEARLDAHLHTAGTGGFTHIGQSTLPILEDLATPGAPGPTIVPLRVRAGDDASCLNLDRAQRPRLLGVRPGLLRGRFTFTAAAPGLEPARAWDLLRPDPAQPDILPAIGDANSIQWALRKKLGDLIEYRDQQGRVFHVKLVGAVANSILQGSLVVDETAFRERFPAESGWRQFLLDAPPDTAGELAVRFQDRGLEWDSAVDRLNAFNAVQNTYLGAFGVLGGLGLLLGSAGLGIVLLRNILERRAELAFLLAAGWRAALVRRLVLREHILLLVIGLALGTVAALVAVLPALLTPGSGLPWRTLLLILAAVTLNGLLWTWLATRAALRGNLLAGLRHE